MKPQTITILVTVGVLLTTTLTLIVYDVVAYHLWGPEATISRETFRLSKEWPVIPLIVGGAVCLLFGHLFWSQQFQP